MAKISNCVMEVTAPNGRLLKRYNLQTLPGNEKRDALYLLNRESQDGKLPTGYRVASFRWTHYEL
jgi:hypothetical protein